MDFGRTSAKNEQNKNVLKQQSILTGHHQIELIKMCLHKIVYEHRLLVLQLWQHHAIWTALPNVWQIGPAATQLIWTMQPLAVNTIAAPPESICPNVTMICALHRNSWPESSTLCTSWNRQEPKIPNAASPNTNHSIKSFEQNSMVWMRHSMHSVVM